MHVSVIHISQTHVHMCVYVCVCVCMSMCIHLSVCGYVWLRLYVSLWYELHLKSSKPQQDRRAIAEPFHCGNTLPILIKLEKTIPISVLFLLEWDLFQIERYTINQKSKLELFEQLFVCVPYIYIYIYIW